MDIQEHAPSRWGKSVSVKMTGSDVALAIMAYLVAHDIHISGPRTITVNGSLIENGRVFVDPSGFLVCDGERHPHDAKESIPEVCGPAPLSPTEAKGDVAGSVSTAVVGQTESRETP